MAKVAEKKPAAKPAPKSEIIANIAAATDLTKTQVASVLDALDAEIKKSLSKKGTGAFQLPGLFKVEVKRKPAQPAKKGVKILGQIRDIPAKPACNVVKIRPLKALKDSV